MIFREMAAGEACKVKMIDATCYIRNAWRMIDGKLQLVEIDWTDHELPNGTEWHIERFEKTVSGGGKAFGCFDNNVLVGYATVNSEIFGNSSRHVLLDQLFVSKNYRNCGIGKMLFRICARQASEFGAEKLYLCAGSSEATIAFYKRLGCVKALEINQELLKEDPNDFQLEFNLR